MPYLIFAAGIIIGVYAFLRFFMRANPAQIRQFFLTVFLAIYALFLLELAVTGRVVLAILLLLVLVPFIIMHYRRKAKETKALPPPEE